MELTNGYKQTEVGIIPEDWVERKLGAVCKLINGRGFKPYEWKDSGLPIIRIQNLNGSDDFNYFDGHYAKKLEIEPQQLLFAWSGSRGTSFGPHVWNGPLGLLNYHTWKVQVDPKTISEKFFLHALKQLTKFIEEQAHGAAALVHVQKWEMETFKFPLPPTKAEQEAIAEALSDADAWIESLEQLIAKKRRIKAGVSQALLTGKQRLPGFSGEWEVKRVEEFSTVERGRVISHSEISKATNPTYPVYSSQTSNLGVMGHLDSYEFDGEYITWTTDGANAGTIFARTGRFNCTNVCGTILPSAGDHRFIAGALSTVSKSHVSRHLGNPKLMNDVMKKISIHLPPTKAEQTAIADILTTMDTELDALAAKLRKARQIKQGMMQELLTGKTRLV